MEIVIAAGGMPFGPTTLEVKSLGGSETAVINIAKALKKRGHLVTVFCPLPNPGAKDYIEPGNVCADGVRWQHINNFLQFAVSTEIDLLVVSRDFNLLRGNFQAKKVVFWTHDLAVHTYTNPQLAGLSWNIDEVWTVSEFHRQQFHSVTGYPLTHIRATRNGITPIETMDMGRIDNQLIYSARPERGLEHLVKPGGIMAMLPDFNLKVTMYDNYPPQLEAYYRQLWTWAGQLKNVELLGPKTQGELRQLLRNSFAYVYPTGFEEVSCILARECISVGLPIIATAKAALPETIGSCGILLPDKDVGSYAYCENFARTVNQLKGDRRLQATLRERAEARIDLDWEGVAAQWEAWSAPDSVSTYSRAWSLMEDSDIIPAKALLESLPDKNEGEKALHAQILNLYPYLTGEETLASYYERYFVEEDKKNARQHRTMVGNPRFEAIAAEVAKVPDGRTILDYGCAEGVIILDLAARFPGKYFIGIDHAATNIALCEKYAKEMGLNNVEFHTGGSDNWPLTLSASPDSFICSEVLEHVPSPWELAEFLEKKCGRGGKAIITVPSGPWETSGLYKKEQWPWRAHIWHINKWMLRKMFADKEDCQMQNLTNGSLPGGRAIGHLVFTYKIDHKPVHEVDPLEKAKEHRSRQTVGAAIIAKDSAEGILKMLNSIHDKVQQVSIALGPTNDSTREIIGLWELEQPWVQLFLTDVPAIQPYVFGFDDARNISVKPLTTDWVLWIDTDEYISGNFTHYLRNSAHDSIAIHQHHFTCDPRGAPTQLDKPARLFRVNRGFQFYGKVHEHAEKGYNGGPGFALIAGDCDIGHTGYVNEEIRRGRFGRNFPLLEWDRKVYPTRRLGYYLWLRDIIHRMRYCIEGGNQELARRTAEEALAFYNSLPPDIDSFGVGGINALAYYSEAMAFLGRGRKIQVQVVLDGQPGGFEGIFESEEDVAKLIAKNLKPELDKRKSGYWQ